MPPLDKKRLITPVMEGLLLFLLFTTGQDAFAKTLPHNKHSVNFMGSLGLNTIPSARMDEKGTMRAGISTSDPYIHSFLGFQIAKPLYINFRQTAEVSSLTDEPDQYLPGIDIKLRLAEETATRPEIAIGLDSAFGDKRLASEYLVFSKRYDNFDFTTGVAWGSLGSAGHIKNPLRAVSSHFDKPRVFNSEESQTIDNWFTGEDIGIFGGVEYHTPLKGLSVKADYGANDYIGEQEAIDGFDEPDPWSVALNYKPWKQADLSLGIIGGEKVMARFSLQDQVLHWPGRGAKKVISDEILSPRPEIEKVADIFIAELNDLEPAGRQIGHFARIAANKTPAKEALISLELEHKGLKGSTIHLPRQDLEKAILHNHGSPEELWHDTIIEDTKINLISFGELFKKQDWNRAYDFRLILDNQISLSEEDTGILHRNSVIFQGEKSLPFGLATGAGIRFNYADNLDRLSEFRIPVEDPVRSNEDMFADRRFAIDRLYTGWLKSLTPSTHIALTTGYLEEMIAGYGGEILYRPFGKTVAIGAEAWKVRKRDPETEFNAGLSSDTNVTGHLNLFYEVPNENMTFFGKVGRYLDEDFGGTFGVKNRFDNGTVLEGFVTVTDQSDIDIFGDDTNVYGGIKLSLPFGNFPFVPDGSEVRLTAAPFARDSGQTLRPPLPLYEVTEPIAYRSLSRSWSQVLD